MMGFLISEVKVGLRDKAVFSVFVESHSHPQHVMSVMLHEGSLVCS